MCARTHKNTRVVVVVVCGVWGVTGDGWLVVGCKWEVVLVVVVEHTQTQKQTHTHTHINT